MHTRKLSKYYVFDAIRMTGSILLLLVCLIPASCLGFSGYSNDELDQLEKEFVQLINQSDTVIRTPLANEYINHIAKSLAQHGDMNQPNFFIVKSNEINAFAGPGGHIGVNTQLILATENESELAAVMAHEMSHVRQHHLYRMLEHQKQMRVPMLASLLASMALGAINPALSTGAMMGSLSGFAQDNINFVRSNEKEADSIGISMLGKAGFDPRGMAGFFKKMQQNSRYQYSDNLPALLRTHPLDEERIAEAENRCAQQNLKPVKDALDYHLFKALVQSEVARDDKQLLDYYQHRLSTAPQNQAYRYGLALTFLQLNQNQQALNLLTSLQKMDPNNLYYAIAIAHAKEGLGNAQGASKDLSALHANFPDSYALYVEYGDALLQAQHPDEASMVFLKGRRRFGHDLPLCHQLAKAQARSKRQGYAYLTLAECHLLEGARFDALRTLKHAKSYVGQDKMLKARIDAKIEEIKPQS